MWAKEDLWIRQKVGLFCKYNCNGGGSWAPKIDSYWILPVQLAMFELELLTQLKSVFYIVDSYDETVRIDTGYLVKEHRGFSDDRTVVWKSLTMCWLKLHSLLSRLKKNTHTVPASSKSPLSVLWWKEGWVLMISIWFIPASVTHSDELFLYQFTLIHYKN